jgi:hypothetical protein
MEPLLTSALDTMESEDAPLYSPLMVLQHSRYKREDTEATLRLRRRRLLTQSLGRSDTLSPAPTTLEELQSRPAGHMTMHSNFHAQATIKANKAKKELQQIGDRVHAATSHWEEELERLDKLTLTTQTSHRNYVTDVQEVVDVTRDEIDHLVNRTAYSNDEVAGTLTTLSEQMNAIIEEIYLSSDFDDEETNTYNEGGKAAHSGLPSEQEKKKLFKGLTNFGKLQKRVIGMQKLLQETKSLYLRHNRILRGIRTEDIPEMVKEHSKLKVEVDRLHAQLREVEESKVSLAKIMDQKLITYRGKLDKANTDVKLMNKRVLQYKTDISEMSKVKGDGDRELNRLRIQNEKLRDSFLKSERSKEQVSSQISSERSQISELEDVMKHRCEDMETKLKEARAELGRAEKRHDSAMVSQQKKEDSLRHELTNLHDKIISSQELHIRELRAKDTEKSIATKKLERELEKSEVALAEMNRKFQQLSDAVPPVQVTKKSAALKPTPPSTPKKTRKLPAQQKSNGARLVLAKTSSTTDSMSFDQGRQVSVSDDHVETEALQPPSMPEEVPNSLLDAMPESMISVSTDGENDLTDGMAEESSSLPLAVESLPSVQSAYPIAAARAPSQVVRTKEIAVMTAPIPLPVGIDACTQAVAISTSSPVSAHACTQVDMPLRVEALMEPKEGRIIQRPIRKEKKVMFFESPSDPSTVTSIVDPICWSRETQTTVEHARFVDASTEPQGSVMRNKNVGTDKWMENQSRSTAALTPESTMLHVPRRPSFYSKAVYVEIGTDSDDLPKDNTDASTRTDTPIPPEAVDKACETELSHEESNSNVVVGKLMEQLATKETILDRWKRIASEEKERNEMCLAEIGRLQHEVFEASSRNLVLEPVPRKEPEDAADIATTVESAASIGSQLVSTGSFQRLAVNSPMSESEHSFSESSSTDKEPQNRVMFALSGVVDAESDTILLHILNYYNSLAEMPSQMPVTIEAVQLLQDFLHMVAEKETTGHLIVDDVMIRELVAQYFFGDDTANISPEPQENISNVSHLSSSFPETFPDSQLLSEENEVPIEVMSVPSWEVSQAILLMEEECNKAVLGKDKEIYNLKNRQKLLQQQLEQHKDFVEYVFREQMLLKGEARKKALEKKQGLHAGMIEEESGLFTNRMKYTNDALAFNRLLSGNQQDIAEKAEKETAIRQERQRQWELVIAALHPVLTPAPPPSTLPSKDRPHAVGKRQPPKQVFRQERKPAPQYMMGPKDSNDPAKVASVAVALRKEREKAKAKEKEGTISSTRAHRRPKTVGMFPKVPPSIHHPQPL